MPLLGGHWSSQNQLLHVFQQLEDRVVVGQMDSKHRICTLITPQLLGIFWSCTNHTVLQNISLRISHSFVIPILKILCLDCSMILVVYI